MTPLGCILSIIVFIAAIAVIVFIKCEKYAKKLEKCLDEYRSREHWL